ncbi:rCG35843, isoform CRA_a [Rattus norvegicus]|uniref:RCG35843, isoform CRA_a n=1 Tax=Rattus norvegicus TaxID=10116 RepID=A6IKU8_RAT|nr:rCG35843, isoform CRA_a [Rattus norvegicus]
MNRSHCSQLEENTSANQCFWTLDQARLGFESPSLK